LAEKKEELPEEVWSGLQVLRKDIDREISPFAALSQGILKIKDPLAMLQCYLLLLILRELRKRSS